MQVLILMLISFCHYQVSLVFRRTAAITIITLTTLITITTLITTLIITLIVARRVLLPGRSMQLGSSTLAWLLGLCTR